MGWRSKKYCNIGVMWKGALLRGQREMTVDECR